MFGPMVAFTAVVALALAAPGRGLSGRERPAEPGESSPAAAVPPPRNGCAHEVLPTFFPDPRIMRRGRDFFLTKTSQWWVEDGVYLLYHSTDLTHWREIGSVFQTIPEWMDPGNARLWAGSPYYSQERERYYFYYCVPVAVATSEALLGPRQDHGVIYRGGGIDGHPVGGDTVIDPFFFLDTDGTAYLFFVEMEYGRWIGMVELSDDWLSIREDTLRRVYVPREPWEGMGDGTWLAEGLSVVKRNGRYTLFYTGGYLYYGGNYSIGALQAERIEGPWTPVDGNPIKTTGSTVNSVGSMSAPLEMPDGSWWTFYHGYLNSRGKSWSRTLFLEEVCWDEHGVPYFRQDPVAARMPEDLVGAESLVVFGDFGCGDRRPDPWVLNGDAAIVRNDDGRHGVEIGHRGGRTGSVEQRLPFVSRGEYRLQASLEPRANPCTLGVRSAAGEALGDVRSSASDPIELVLDFALEESGDLEVWVEAEPTHAGTSARVGSVRLEPLFTRQLYGVDGTASGYVLLERMDGAAKGLCFAGFSRIGQELHFRPARVPESGWYEATLFYRLMDDSLSASMNVYVNDGFQNSFSVSRDTGGPGSGFSRTKIPVYLYRGDSRIALKYEVESCGSIAIDTLRLDRAAVPGRFSERTYKRRVYNLGRQFFEEDAGKSWSFQSCPDVHGAGGCRLMVRLGNGQFQAEADPSCRGWIPWLKPGLKHDVAVVWTAPQDGRVRVETQASKYDSNLGDGVRLQVRRNGVRVWPETTEWLCVTEVLPALEVELDLDVARGDEIQFVVNRNAGDEFDLAVIDPYIHYTLSEVAPGATRTEEGL